MKYTVLIILVSTICTFVLFNIAEAVGVKKQLSGLIILTKAKEIQALEADGYECKMKGISIEIIPIGQKNAKETSFFIPRSKRKKMVSEGQQIIGKYAGTETIGCTHVSLPPVNVQLNKVTKYGTTAG